MDHSAGSVYSFYVIKGYQLEDSGMRVIYVKSVYWTRVLFVAVPLNIIFQS